MKKFIILLSLLILLPLVATSKPLIPIMKTLFTDVTGTVPDAEEIARKAELFRQQTGVAPFIVVLPDINNEASLRQNGKAIRQRLVKNVINMVFLRLCNIRMPPKAAPVKTETVLV